MMSLRETFTSERVFPTPCGFGTRRGLYLPVEGAPLASSSVVDTSTTVCLLGHSIMDDLRLLLSSQDVDLLPNFNLPTVTPLWKTVKGLTFPIFVDTCLEYLDYHSPEDAGHSRILSGQCLVSYSLLLIMLLCGFIFDVPLCSLPWFG